MYYIKCLVIANVHKIGTIIVSIINIISIPHCYYEQNIYLIFCKCIHTIKPVPLHLKINILSGTKNILHCVIIDTTMSSFTMMISYIHHIN